MEMGIRYVAPDAAGHCYRIWCSRSMRHEEIHAAINVIQIHIYLGYIFGIPNYLVSMKAPAWTLKMKNQNRSPVCMTITMAKKSVGFHFGSALAQPVSLYSYLGQSQYCRSIGRRLLGTTPQDILCFCLYSLDWLGSLFSHPIIYRANSYLNITAMELKIRRKVNSLVSHLKEAFGHFFSHGYWASGPFSRLLYFQFQLPS